MNNPFDLIGISLRNVVRECAVALKEYGVDDGIYSLAQADVE
jgi:hypothetical protein